ncbi:MAG: hypothetical protein L0H26_05745 [Microlunatus sp.]|nr:hypothetical protein [Microlunatus sp.]
MSDPYPPERFDAGPTPAALATARDPRLGIAYAVAVRTEGGGEHTVQQVVLTYRLRRHAPNGRPLPVLQVEMRGKRLLGMVAEGDLLQAPGPLPPGGAIQFDKVTNLTTGASVAVFRPRTSVVALVIVLVLLGMLVFLVLFILVGMLAS